MADFTADHIAAGTGGFEPQRMSNFVLIINGLTDNGNLLYLGIENLELPYDSDSKIAIRWGNEVRYVTGDTEMSEMPIVLRDFVDSTARVRKAFNDWRDLVYNPETGKKGLASSYKKTATIHLYAPDGESFKRVARCEGVFPMARPGGSLSMNGGTSPVMLNSSLSCDKVKWTVA
jgi:hypothetical protein